MLRLEFNSANMVEQGQTDRETDRQTEETDETDERDETIETERQARQADLQARHLLFREQ